MKKYKKFMYNNIQASTKTRLNKLAFTLVELIVVITILAILSTIGFVSYSGYIAGTRDTNRISQLKSISEGLELYSTNHNLPLPDNSVTVKADGSNLAIQGYAGKNVLETITYSTEGVDPKDKTYFSYYLTNDRKYFQLMAFLEEEENLQNKATAVDYTTRYTTVFGKKLGILTDTDNNPIQEVSTVTTAGELDIVTTTDNYIAHFTDNSVLSGTGKTLKGAVAGHGLVGYWSFDEISNGSFIDYSENNSTGTMNGTVTISSGKSGNAANFDGNSGYVVDLIENIGGNSSSPHTILAWINPNSIPECGDSNSCRQWILELGKLDNENPTTISNTGPGTHHWTVGGKFSTQFGIWDGTKTEVDLNTGSWQYIAISFDGEILKSYINGKLASNYSQELGSVDMNIFQSHLFLGSIDFNYNYVGYIDELRIYNRVLKPEEIRRLHNLDK